MNKWISVLSLIGTIISVATFAFDLRGRPIFTLGPGTRFAIGVVLAAIGVGSWLTTPPDKTAATPLPLVAVTSTSTLSATPRAVPIVEPVAAATLASAERQHPHVGRSAISFQGAEDAELTMLVRASVDGRAFSGSLVQSCAKDESLEGLITCELTLRVRIVDETAFSVDARGGGFTERAAERQARERLTALTEEKIRTWRQKT